MNRRKEYRMRFLHRLPALCLIALAGCSTPGQMQASASSGQNTPDGKSIVVSLHAQNGSREDGTATLTQVGSSVRVKLALLHAPPGVPQPAHIHPGSCNSMNPSPRYPLLNVLDGNATIVLQQTDLTSLQGDKYVINVHRSTSNLMTYVACGEIK